MDGSTTFADFITPNDWSIPIARVSVGATLPSAEFTVRNADFVPNIGSFTNIASFGVDATGNVYLVDLDGEIFVIEPTPAAAAARRRMPMGVRVDMRDRERRFDRGPLPR